MQLTIDLHWMGVIKTYTTVFRSQMRPNSEDLERRWFYRVNIDELK